jgi:hypothetical protein
LDLGTIHSVISNCAYKSVMLPCGHEATED